MNLLKYLVFLVSCYFLPLIPGLAQNEFAFLSTKERFIYEPAGFASQDGTYTLFYYHKGWRNFYTFSERGEIISTVVSPYPSQLQQEKPLGIHETKEAYHYFFQSSTHRKSLEVISLGKHAASQTFSLLPLTTHRQEKFLQALSLKGKLYFLLMNRRKNTLIVVSPDNEKKLERSEFVVDRELLRTLRKQDFTSISGDREVPFSSLGTAKAYLPEENRLLLTLESDTWKGTEAKGISVLLALNLKTEEASFRLLFGPDHIKQRYQTSTFLCEETFIKASSNKHFFNLAFYSFPALEVQQTFSYGDTTELALIQRRLVQREGDKAPEYIERREIKKVLRSLNKGTLAVNARNLDGTTFQLQIGSFGYLQSAGAPMMVPMGGGSISTPGGSVSIPVSYGFSTIPGRSSTFSYTFETSFAAGNLEPGVSGPQSLEEKERALVESLDVRKSDRLLYLPVSFRKSMVGHYSAREKIFTFYLLTTDDLYKTSWNAVESPDGF